MGKRQVRIFDGQIEAKLPELMQKELNLVLKNGTTLHGKVYHSDASHIYIKDTIGRKHVIIKGDIEEVIVDHTALY